jgi:TonB family protein
MKICPKCQQQYPNGFQYCPNDTEFLITNEEYVRRTKPLASAPIAETVQRPAAEVVPITNPFPDEAPSAPARIIDQQAKEAPAGLPFRNTEPVRSGQTEPIRPAQNAPRPEAQPFAQNVPRPDTQSHGQNVPRPGAQPPAQTAPIAGGNGGAHASQPGSQPWRQSQQAPQAAPSGSIPARLAPDTPSLSFSIPEQGGLVSRLIAGLKNIGDSFKSAPPLPPGATGDFQFLLREESLAKRILGELRRSVDDFRRDPRRFLVELATGEGTNRTRRNMLLAGSEMAIVGFFTFYFISQALGDMSKTNGLLINVFFAGFALYLLACYLMRGFLLYQLIYRLGRKFTVPKVALEFANWTPLVVILLLSILLNNYGFYCRIFPSRCAPPEEVHLEELALVAPVDAKIDIKLKEKAVKEKSIGGSKPKPQKASGGGGGGRQEPTPPSKGVPPQMALTPPIIPPDPDPPKIKNPSLAVTPTIYGDPKALPPMRGPIGDPSGVPAPPSSGPGSGAGIGRGSGAGVGSGAGGGLGPGRGGNLGGGNMGIGGGGSVEPMTASLRPTILYREKAKYTEEARQNKVQGSVVLQVVFHANGTITDVRVVRGLPDGLTEKAIEAAKRIRFQPAVKNGSPVSVRGTLDFSFNLY